MQRFQRKAAILHTGIDTEARAAPGCIDELKRDGFPELSSLYKDITMDGTSDLLDTQSSFDYLSKYIKSRHNCQLCEKDSYCSPHKN